MMPLDVSGLTPDSAKGAGAKAVDTPTALSRTKDPKELNGLLQNAPGSTSGLASQPQRPDLGARDVRAATQNPLRAFQAEAPTQFQSFVQESTGKLLPVFGARLFEAPSAYNADSAAPPPSEYILGPGDEVRVQISGVMDYAEAQTIDRNGQIHLPKVGAIHLSGVELKDLESSLKKRIASVFTNVNVSASLGKLRGITVYVVGQARQPGTYNLSSLSTLINAVFASGGPNASGSMRQIELRRGGKLVSVLDLYAFIAKGDKSKDAALLPGDVITIAPAGPRVALTGATDHAAIYELNADTRVQEVLGLGGGVPILASRQKALIERIDPQQAKAPRRVEHIDLEAGGLAHVLKDGDVLTLLPLRLAFASAVTLQGAVAQPLRHALTDGMRVQDLIPDQDALITRNYYQQKNRQVQLLDEDKAKKENSNALVDRMQGIATQQINWDYAVIERQSKLDLRTELISFNLDKAVLQKDPQHNLLLQAGDVVHIMGSNDLQMPSYRKTQLVRVEGEVAVPGVYQVLPGETLSQLLQRAGGITQQGYLYGMEFTREAVRKQQQQNLDQVASRLEAQMQSASATLSANLTGDRAAQAQVQQQQQQQRLQGQITRLKAMRSKGRVALELSLGKNTLASLPSVPLEDGDAIFVPTTPTFVSAAGSVNNDNVLLYKPGKTVADVMASAGLTEDAEPDDAFVLRADGSVLSRKGLPWFSSFNGASLMPGDTVVVPPKIDRESGYNFTVRALRDWSQILSNFGLGAVAIKALKNQ